MDNLSSATSAKYRHTLQTVWLLDMWQAISFRLINDFFKEKHFYCAKRKLDEGEQDEYITAMKIQKINLIKNEEKQLKQAQEFLRKHNHVFCYLSTLHK